MGSLWTGCRVVFICFGLCSGFVHLKIRKSKQDQCMLIQKYNHYGTFVGIWLKISGFNGLVAIRFTVEDLLNQNGKPPLLPYLCYPVQAL